MHSAIVRRLRLAAGMLLLLSSWASASPPLTAADLARLPVYCQAKVGALQSNQAEVKHWEQAFGAQNWLHLHHFCSGEAWLARAQAAFGSDSQNRAFYLGESVNNYMYVIRAWPQDFQLQPDANLGVGKAWKLSGQDMKAISFYVKAIELRPDFAQAYAALADTWIDRGDKAKAREVLAQGLKNTANDARLVRRMARLDAGSSTSQPAPAGTPAPGRTTPGQGSAKKP